MLSELGVTPELRRGGPGPALFKPVTDGHAIALSTAAAAEARGVIVRPLAPARDLRFELLWGDETPAPALNAFIGRAQSLAEPAPLPERRLVAVAA
jgi:hypothetical protein